MILTFLCALIAYLLLFYIRFASVPGSVVDISRNLESLDSTFVCSFSTSEECFVLSANAMVANDMVGLIYEMWVVPGRWLLGGGD